MPRIRCILYQKLSGGPKGLHLERVSPGGVPISCVLHGFLRVGVLEYKIFRIGSFNSRVFCVGFSIVSDGLLQLLRISREVSVSGSEI